MLEPKVDHLETLLRHQLRPVHLEGMARPHQTIHLPFVDSLEDGSSGGSVASQPIFLIFHAGHKFHGHHLQAAGRGRGTGKEEWKHQKVSVGPTRVRCLFHDAKNFTGVVVDFTCRLEFGLEALVGVHAAVREQVTDVVQSRRLWKIHHVNIGACNQDG